MKEPWIPTNPITTSGARRRIDEVRRHLRQTQVAAARDFAEIERERAYVFSGCASIAEFGERHGYSAREARDLAGLGRALAVRPDLENLFLDGRITLESASVLSEILAEPGLEAEADTWLRKAQALTTRGFLRAARRRLAEIRREQPVVPLTVHVSYEGRDDFDRARIVASRRARRALTPGEAFEAVVDDYLTRHDPLRKGAGTRRLPHTSRVRGRYVPMDVRRDVWQGNGDTCSVPGCVHEMFLEFAHLTPHAEGGSRESENLIRLCRTHHVLFDLGLLRLEEPTDGGVVFISDEGKVLGPARGPP